MTFSVKINYGIFRCLEVQVPNIEHLVRTDRTSNFILHLIKWKPFELQSFGSCKAHYVIEYSSRGRMTNPIKNKILNRYFFCGQRGRVSPLDVSLIGLNRPAR